MYLPVFVLILLLVVAILLVSYFRCQKKLKLANEKFAQYLGELEQKNQRLYRRWKEAESDLAMLKKTK